ncbi:FANCM protein, partial [Upupa epops]|nr:FANCM protein [Upupa epops]
LPAAPSSADPGPVDPLPATPSPATPELGAGGFSAAAGSVWIYPTNLPVRGYQLRMARSALLANTLLSLPTGLGKTFVAAVVMYNFYRWFPLLMLSLSFPGGTQALSRRELWTEKRVFFLTPQIMVNDLSRGTCPAVEIKCLVIDEAHKALGNHAYCQVVRELSKYTHHFRVLALSATPGSDTKAVQQVISNLLIAQIEVCAEDSPEIQPYSHQRQVEKIVVPLGEELVAIQSAYIRVLEAFAGRLIRVGVLARQDVPSLTKYQIILARDQYRKNPSAQNMGIHQGVIEGDFALCISLYHGYELLLQMGARSLFIYLGGIMDGSKGLTRTKTELSQNEDFMKLYQQLGEMFSDTMASVSGSGNRTVFANKEGFIYSHPKLKKLEEIVIEHFTSWNKARSGEVGEETVPVDTRVMIFSSFRDSVQEIAEMLSRLKPVVKAMMFVGHSTGKSTRGFTQKEQLEVVKRFREGGYNTLVSTCVGEEGLDIGEVDLIICFDAQKSPIRLVQRMGRTGRRRRGRIVVILAEGREERTYNQSQCNRRSIHRALSGNSTLHFYQHSPRMVPEGINPQLHKMFITAESCRPSDSKAPSTERRASSLQHKSLLSCVTGQRQTLRQETWSLSPEEFEIWDRLYRIKEGDGVKDPVLPRVRFETLENVEGVPEREEGTAQELSLSEWRIWQNRPFPTAMVSHSDRCYHFIGVMEMIDVMRQQQGACSYQLEMERHLHMEDVNIARGRRHLSRQKGSARRDVAHSPRAPPFFPDTGAPDSELFSVFKSTKVKAPRRSSGLRLDGTALPTDTAPADTAPAAAANTAAADTALQRDEELEVTFDLNESLDLCDSSERTAVQDSAAAQGVRAGDQACKPLSNIHTDSGYSSFTAEKSPVSSDLFYLPASYPDSFAALGPSEDPPWLKQRLSPVRRLLAQSPPSLDGPGAFEDTVRAEEVTRPTQKATSESCSEGQRDRAFNASSGAAPQGGVSGERSASSQTRSSDPVAFSEAGAAEGQEALCWDDSLGSVFDSEELAGVPETPPAVDPALTHSPSDGCFGRKGRGLEADGRVALAEEKSTRFFEEDTSKGRFSSSRPAVRLDAGGSVSRAAAERSSRLFPSGPGSGKPITEQPPNGKAGARAPPGGSSVTEQLLGNSDLCDSSEDLFSVTFDLGFSIEDCESDIWEGRAGADDTRRSRAAAGGAAAVAGTEENSLNSGSGLELSPERDGSRPTRRGVSTPLPLRSRSRKAPEGSEARATAVLFSEWGDRRTGSGGPPGALASSLSTSVRRIRRAPVEVSSGAGQEAPEGLPADEAKKGLLRQTLGSSCVDVLGSPLGGTGELGDANPRSSCAIPAAGAGSESEEEVVFQRRSRKKPTVVKSPDVLSSSDSESPIRPVRKRPHPVTVVTQVPSAPSSLRAQCLPSLQRPSLMGVLWVSLSQSAARQFLDEEAELSQQDAEDVSSDESDGTENELSSSLAQFLNDDAEVTQVLSDCEMQGVYLTSVRSPALGSRYKMVHRDFDTVAVFSQIPEQDPSYEEDSFCVGEEEEEPGKNSESSEEEMCVNFSLLNNESFTGGRKQYLTRRRKKLNQARREEACSAPVLRKPSRIIVISDSSEEETGASKEKPGQRDCVRAGQGDRAAPTALPPASSLQHKKIAGDVVVHRSGTDKNEVLLSLEASVSEALDFQPEHQARNPRAPPAVPASAVGKEDLQAPPEVNPPPPAATASSAAPAPFPQAPLERTPPPCILVDSREISSGGEVISSLKAVHGLRVQVCSLGSSDYVVSNRMAVERQAQSELLSSVNRSKVTQRIQRLQSEFERVCVIVEKDRAKAGETARRLPRTQYYDGVLAALLQAGVRVLFSSCQGETAALLRDLVVLEQRKTMGIRVPTEVEGPRREVLNFYLSIPNLSYVAALNMCHHFHSTRDMINSSPQQIAAGAQVSLRKAEEIYRYLHHAFDLQMLPESLCSRGRSSAAATS